MIWFTADWHLFHENIIKYCDRPFKNRHHMNKTLLENYHAVVKDTDEVYFVGDLTMWGQNNFDRMQSIVEALPGTKHLILGNHDRFKPFAYHEMGFVSVHTALKTSFYTSDMSSGGTEFILAHDPAWAQIPNTFWLCGHVHNLFKTTKTKDNTMVINVGVDVWNFKPISLDQVYKEIKELTAR